MDAGNASTSEPKSCHSNSTVHFVDSSSQATSRSISSVGIPLRKVCKAHPGALSCRRHTPHCCCVGKAKPAKYAQQICKQQTYVIQYRVLAFLSASTSVASFASPGISVLIARMRCWSACRSGTETLALPSVHARKEKNTASTWREVTASEHWRAQH